MPEEQGRGRRAYGLACPREFLNVTNLDRLVLSFSTGLEPVQVLPSNVTRLRRAVEMRAAAIHPSELGRKSGDLMPKVQKRKEPNKAEEWQRKKTANPPSKKKPKAAILAGNPGPGRGT